MADGGNEVPSGPVPVETGEWASWMTWGGNDPFEDQSGPFYFREEDGGRVRCAFQAAQRHMNGGGFMHGGCMMTFADYCLFAIAWRQLADVRAVTISLNGEFMGPAAVGDLVEATGEVVRDGGSLVFVRGMLSTGGKPMMNFSGVIKKIRAR